MATAEIDLHVIEIPSLRETLSRGRTRSDGELVLSDVRRCLDEGREVIRRQFEAGGSAEHPRQQLSRQMDGLIQGILDHADRWVYQRANPTMGEQLAVVAVGGYGRGELAPFSDVDLLFLYRYKRSAYAEQVAEFLLYRLWDLSLKVGQATRSIGECLKFARDDLSVRTSLLEARFIWGDRKVFDEFYATFETYRLSSIAEFIEAKLAERDERHKKVGDSRYLLEPNIKEGKGGLRDLQTLVWLGRYIYRIKEADELVGHAVLTDHSLATFKKSMRFLWTVRFHLHYLAGRAEERLTFDLQPEVARWMGYRDRARSIAVERFMKHYYLVAKDVGTLTRVVCAALEAQHRRKVRFPLPWLAFGHRRINGFVVIGNRLSLGTPDLFVKRPVAMLELFHLAQQRSLDIHPEALAAVHANLRRIDAKLRADPEANRLFLEILCSPKEPALALGRMNEAGLLGRFVPDFGRVVAQMQHNLYHVYTVDEHTIRAIEVLSELEHGKLLDELPLSTEIMSPILSRPELYLATFLHDIGKGRGGNHSVTGAEIALRFCRRLGLSEASTETVTWLVEQHLVMSRFAFKRDSEDPKTIQDFVEIVQSPERLRLLLVLTAADIRAVGPNVWNGWKGQLLRELYHEAAAAMAAGDPQGRRRERVEAGKAALAGALAQLPAGPWSTEAIEHYLARHDPRYWLGFKLEEHLRHAELVRRADAIRAPLTLEFRVDHFGARTEVVLYAADHPGLFMKIAGALALSGASIVDAHIFTTADGMALDVLGFQDADRRSAIDDEPRHRRIAANIERALGGEIWLERALAGRRSLPQRADVFRVEPRVLIDNSASRTHSVVEVNGRDRPGLLFDVAKALKELGLVIHSAHISTYGERVVDVFYVKDVFGMKITQRSKLARIERYLLEALTDPIKQDDARVSGAEALG